MEKKAQLAMFMIFGFAIVILIGLAYFGSQEATYSEFKTSQSQVEELFIGKGKYTTYIKSCFDQAVKQSLLLVGNQGGAIYNDQAIGGKQLTSTKHYNLASGTNVLYFLLAPQVGPTIKTPPAYPFKSDTISYLSSDYSIFGSGGSPFANNLKNPTIPLCDRMDSSGEVYCAGLLHGLDTNNINDHNSIQEYLQLYITKLTQDCIKFDTLPELKGQDVVVDNFNVSVWFGDTSVTSTLNLNFSINSDLSSSKIKIDEIILEKNVRILQMFDLMTRIRQKDAEDIFFDVRKDSHLLHNCLNAQPCKKPGMEVERISIQITPGKFDSLIGIRDTTSLLDGKYFMFRAAFENRYPALDLLAPQFNQTQVVGDYDAVLVEGMKLIIDAYGYDPDDDNHGLNGFMTSGYDYELKSWDGLGETNSGLTSFSNDFYKYQSSEEDPCNPSNPFVLGPHVFANSLKLCLKKQNSYPASFSNNRKVEYTLGKKDTGSHSIKVKVCDKSNLCDWQELKILVVPLEAFECELGAGLTNCDKLNLYYDPIPTEAIFGRPQPSQTNQPQPTDFIPLNDQPEIIIDDDNDLDNDGITNDQDLDADGDGITDAIDDDDDNDGIPDNQDNDDDNDGTLDIDDPDVGGGALNNDIDGDGIPNDQDDDIDGDGVFNANDLDDDGDGVPDLKDVDDNNNGILDEEETQQPTPPPAPVYETPYDMPEFQVLISSALATEGGDYFMYYLEDGYAIVKNTVNNLGPKEVPGDDLFRTLIEKGDDGKENIYMKKKIYDESAQSSVGSDDLVPGKMVHIIYIPGGCTEGSYDSGYCHSGKKCYLNMATEKIEDNMYFVSVSQNCPLDSVCSLDGCQS
ncbi:hypothetical protein HOL83_06805 [Candidatus Woesearchaeota archaeon]|nr:hypothetical protein [Candidatus Woesearchaeota archaeon]